MRIRRQSCRVLSLVLATSLCAIGNGADFPAKIIRIVDGDSLHALHNDEDITIRLNGIDCPELGQPFGRKAKQAASDLAFGKMVTFQSTGTDKYGCTLANVILPDGRSLNQELVRQGYAWWYRKYSDDEDLKRLEAEARAAKRGLWADANPTAPWDWRDAQRNRARQPGADVEVAPTVWRSSIKFDRPSFDIAVNRSRNRVEFESDGDVTTFIVTSETGIGNAKITRRDDTWPKQVLVRLHLTGLESFKASVGKVTLHVSVSSTGANEKRVWISSDGRDEKPITESSPFWTDVMFVGGGRKIPLEDGYFEMRLPVALFKNNPKSITMSWIDFYRG